MSEYDGDQYYEEDDEYNHAGLGRKKKLTRNQQIYGDFVEAYEEQNENLHRQERGFTSQYDNFKAGSTIEQYSAEIEIDIPLSNKKNKQKSVELPKVGKFTMQSFLDTINQGLEKIDEEDNQSDNSEANPIGLNTKIKQHLQLVKINQQSEDEAFQGELDIDNYLEMQRSELRTNKTKKRKTEHQKQLEKQYINSYGMGYKMIEKMGFTLGKGLGKDEQGKQTPVQASFKVALTAKDQAMPQKKKEVVDSSDSEGFQEQKTQADMFEEMFTYKSRDISIQSFLLKMKNKYNTLKEKIKKFDDHEHYKKEAEILESLKLQKQNKLKLLNEEILGLRNIEKDIYHIEKFPHLGLSYKIDLLIIKQTIQKLRPFSLKELKEDLPDQLSKMKKILLSLYKAKEQESLKDYQKLTEFDLKMREAYGRSFISSNKDVVNISLQDETKISQSLLLVIEQTVIPKVQDLIIQKGDIRKCNEEVLDMIQIMRTFDTKLKAIMPLLDRYIKPLCNKFLLTCDLNESHLQIFPWLHIFKETTPLKLDGFLKRIYSQKWRLDNKELSNLISQWDPFLTPKQKHQFLYLYLAPRLLFELEQFQVGTHKKQQVKGFIEYCRFFPASIIQNMLTQTLLPHLIHIYRQQALKNDASHVNEWIKGWEKKVDKISPGLLSKTFQNHHISIK